MEVANRLDERLARPVASGKGDIEEPRTPSAHIAHQNGVRELYLPRMEA